MFWSAPEAYGQESPATDGKVLPQMGTEARSPSVQALALTAMLLQIVYSNKVDEVTVPFLQQRLSWIYSSSPIFVKTIWHWMGDVVIIMSATFSFQNISLYEF